MIILASKSPRRKELLSKLVDEFIIITPTIDEYLYPFEQLSFEKAKIVAQDHPDDIIIAADTLVIKDKVVFGKPKDDEDAKRMLKELSGKSHQVKTVYTILSLNKNIEITRIITSTVYFNNLSSQLIDDYVKTKSPLDKAGGYGIQDKAFNLVNHIEGSYSNIVGLPIEELKADLIDLKIIA